MATDAAVSLLREFLEESGMTQSQFAEVLGIDQSTLSLILAGKRGPNLALVGLLRAFPHRANGIAFRLAAPAEREEGAA